MDRSQAQRQGIQKSRRNPQIINCNKYSQRQITHYIHQKAQERVTSLGHLQRIKGAARDKPHTNPNPSQTPNQATYTANKNNIDR